MSSTPDTTSRIFVAGLDIETTGLSQTDGHRIIEIALAVHELDTGRRVGTYMSRVNPERSIDPDAQAVHGISFDDLIGEPTWGEVAAKVAKVLQRCRYVVAHNGLDFDLPFVYGELARIGQPLPEVGLIDTMLQARWATSDGALPSLEALCFACGVEYDRNKAHAALYDVDVMLECFFRQYPRGFFQLPTARYEFKPMPEGKKARERS